MRTSVSTVLNHPHNKIKEKVSYSPTTPFLVRRDGRSSEGWRPCCSAEDVEVELSRRCENERRRRCGRLAAPEMRTTSSAAGIHPHPAWSRGELDSGERYVKTSNKSRNICNGPLTPVTSTHICNGCCLAPVTYKRARTTRGLASTTPVTNVDFW
jgi:hypothetical protein